MLLYDTSKHQILVTRYGISDLHIVRHGRSEHIYFRHYKRLVVLVDCYLKSLHRDSNSFYIGMGFSVYVLSVEYIRVGPVSDLQTTVIYLLGTL